MNKSCKYKLESEYWVLALKALAHYKAFFEIVLSLFGKLMPFVSISSWIEYPI